MRNPPANRPALPEGLRIRLLRQFLLELGPLLVFFAVFMWCGLLWGTAAYALATAASYALSWYRRRGIPVLPTISAALVLLFAGLTLALQDGLYIKIKPTVVNGFYGIVLGASWLLGLPLVNRVLGADLRLDMAGLRLATIATSLYLIGLAILNEIVWRTMPTEIWVTFKLIVLVGANLVFALVMIALLRQHLIADDPPPEAPPAPDDRPDDRIDGRPGSSPLRG